MRLPHADRDQPNAVSPLTSIVVYTALAGACIPLGGLLGSLTRIHPRWLENEFRHFVIALGGGVLLGAVALVLVPEGTTALPDTMAALSAFVAGGCACFLFERWLGLRRREAPQLTSMLLDYLPETLALGGAAALGGASAPVLALLIGLQNLPEGFNSYRELNRDRRTFNPRVLWTMLALVPLGPLLGLAGYYLLADHPAWLGGIMLFSAGGILYLVFQDIAPQARLRRHWAPPLGAVLGFALAILGQLVVTGYSGH